jgi:succinate dehydrogenase / fumarate reductase flavoprotein subunit
VPSATRTARAGALDRAQGGINAAKNYQNDGDSVYRLFYDTVKGGDFRSREANVYRLAELVVNIIDQCVAQGVPFARSTAACSPTARSAARRSRARSMPGPDRPAAPARRLPGPRAPDRPGQVRMFPRHEMLELVVVEGRARGIVTRDMVTGASNRIRRDAVVLASGGYGNVFYLATYAKGCKRHGHLAAYKKGAAFANPCYTADPPDLHPGLRGASVEAHAHERVAHETTGASGCRRRKGDNAPPATDPRGRARLLPRAALSPLSATSSRATSPRERRSRSATKGRGVGPGAWAFTLDFADAIKPLGRTRS